MLLRVSRIFRKSGGVHRQSLRFATFFASSNAKEQKLNFHQNFCNLDSKSTTIKILANTTQVPLPSQDSSIEEAVIWAIDNLNKDPSFDSIVKTLFMIGRFSQFEHERRRSFVFG